MTYKIYGKTGIKLSAIGFGAMRFDENLLKENKLSECAELILYAHSKDINYLDTAPYYCSDKSEEICGIALKQIPRNSIYVATKANFGTCQGEPTRDNFRRRLELSLKRLNVDYIDFYQMWWILNLESYQSHLDAFYEFFTEAKSEGLIKHISFTSHMPGHELAQVVNDDRYEGILLGYNALNYKFRGDGIIAANRAGMGVVVMNPLGGGLIPSNPDVFSYLNENTDLTVAQAALKFVAQQEEITVALCGFSKAEHVDEAVEVANNLQIRPSKDITAELNLKIQHDDLCTGCGYCDSCPLSIPVPKYMEVYNHIILKGESISGRLSGQWGISADKAKECTACGHCEALCTQHLPIIERLSKIT